jgi:hypothetical protein
MYIKKTHNFPLISLWSANFKCVKWRKCLIVSTTLFSFQNLKLTTRDIIAVLKDTLNITSGPLPIPNPHGTKYFMSMDSQHVKNKHLWISKGQNYVIEMVYFEGVQAEVH